MCFLRPPAPRALLTVTGTETRAGAAEPLPHGRADVHVFAAVCGATSRWPRGRRELRAFSPALHRRSRVSSCSLTSGLAPAPLPVSATRVKAPVERDGQRTVCFVSCVCVCVFPFVNMTNV